MRDRTARVADRLSCGPLCIPVFPLGGKQPGPILCQTGWIGKSTGEMVVCCLAAANSRNPQRISGKHLPTHHSKLADYGDFVLVV